MIDTLETQGALNAIKAEVRSTVFRALQAQQPQELKESSKSKLSSLLKTSDGTKAFEYVIDFLEWAELKHTLKVIETELPLQAAEKVKEQTQNQTTSKKAREEPLLLRALKDSASPAPFSSPTSFGSPFSSKNKLPKLPSPGQKRVFSPIEIKEPPQAANTIQQSQEEVSAVSLYSEITEEIEEVLSFVEDGEGSDDDEGQDSGMRLHQVDSTLDAVNSTLSASDHSGEIDSDADEIIAAEM